MGKRLQPHFSAGVKTTEVTTIATPLGPVVTPVVVDVPMGGELPDNLADGELERIERLGGFTPVPSIEDRVRAQGARVADLLATAPEGEEVTTPGITPRDSDELPPPPPVDNELTHATAPEDEAVEPPVTVDERFEAAEDQAKSETTDVTVDQHAKARRTTKPKGA